MAKICSFSFLYSYVDTRYKQAQFPKSGLPKLTRRRQALIKVSSLVSDQNVGVFPARNGEFSPLRIGNMVIDPPVILAPMAGITNSAYRELCTGFGAPLCISEMVTAGTLLTGNAEAKRIVSFGSQESPRSVQLYGVDPKMMEKAAKLLVEEYRVDHIDLNFGCPMRKVTSKGGGAAIPAHPRLLGNLIGAAVRGAEMGANGGESVPVTVKMRLGITDDIPTFLEAGRVSEAEGAAAVTLHTRFADQLYSPPVHWNALGDLASRLQIPVIGNGDVYEAADALRMMRDTSAAGVMVGRACLGRPWLFRDLASVFEGEEVPRPPCLGEVIEIASMHVEALVAHFDGDQLQALRNMRKMVSLYLYGFDSAAALQSKWLSCTSLLDWEAAVVEGSFDPTEEFSNAGLRHPRLKGGGLPTKQRVALPDQWLAFRDDEDLPMFGADFAVEG